MSYSMDGKCSEQKKKQILPTFKERTSCFCDDENTRGAWGGMAKARETFYEIIAMVAIRFGDKTQLQR